jgi:hypothetical protein
MNKLSSDMVVGGTLGMRIGSEYVVVPGTMSRHFFGLGESTNPLDMDNT